MPTTQPDPAADPNATPSGIVVGVDGSAQAAHGYQWAVRQTGRLGPVTLVTAWHSPWWYKVGAPVIAPDGPGPDIERAAGEVLDDLMTYNPQHPTVEQLVVKGSAGHVLTNAAERATALVLGADEGATATHRLVGSVRTYCAAHSPAPLIVVPERHPLDDHSGMIVVGTDGSPGADAALDWAIGYATPEERIVAVNAWSIPVVTGYEQIAIDPAVIETATVARAAQSVGAAWS
jgi:nucleotide-binding universal stress UspA family protein